MKSRSMEKMKPSRSSASSKSAQGGSAKKGFSLLEVLMALFVLSVGVTAMLSLITTSITASNRSKKAMVASQLAQEGVELVRNIRDTNFILGNPSFQGISNGACGLDVSAPTLSCATPTFGLNLVNVAGVNYFLHSGATPSGFSRKIAIFDSGTDKKILSIVYWGSGWAVPPADNGSDCQAGKNCVYTEAVLTTWGES